MPCIVVSMQEDTLSEQSSGVCTLLQQGSCILAAPWLLGWALKEQCPLAKGMLQGKPGA